MAVGSTKASNAQPRSARWRDDGLAFVHAPRPGELVSLHWDFVCDVLSPARAHALQRSNLRPLAAVNRPAAARAALA